MVSTPARRVHGRNHSVVASGRVASRPPARESAPGRTPSRKPFHWSRRITDPSSSSTLQASALETRSDKTCRVYPLRDRRGLG